MSEKIGEKFIEGRIVNLEKESVENLENLYKMIMVHESSLRDNLDKSMGKLIDM